MKLILKDKTEINIISMSDNYNAKGSVDEDKRSLNFSISDPESNITIEYLAEVLTSDNLSEAKIITDDDITKMIRPCEIVNITDNLADNSHFITIRASYI